MRKQILLTQLLVTAFGLVGTFSEVHALGLKDLKAGQTLEGRVSKGALGGANGETIEVKGQACQVKILGVDEKKLTIQTVIGSQAYAPLALKKEWRLNAEFYTHRAKSERYQRGAEANCWDEVETVLMKSSFSGEMKLDLSSGYWCPSHYSMDSFLVCGDLEVAK